VAEAVGPLEHRPVVIDVGATQAYANAVAMKEDGKAVVVGTASSRRGTSRSWGCGSWPTAARIPGLGRPARVFVGADEADHDGPAVSIQSDGKILVAGGMKRRRDEQPKMAVARLEANGALDTTFAGGVVSIEGRTGAVHGRRSRSVARRANRARRLRNAPIDWQLPGAVSRSSDFMVAQLRPDGTLDPAFGQNGVTLSTAQRNPASTDLASAMVVGADGRILPSTLEDQHTPVWQPLGAFVATAGGAYHSMALSPNGVVQAWGFNGFGEAGDGTTADVLFRKDVAGLSDVTAIAAGIFHSWPWTARARSRRGAGTTSGSWGMGRRWTNMSRCPPRG
jgi:uncharacterized delta-60 repeat protein